MDTRPLTQDEVTIANTPCGSDTDSCPEYGYGYVQTDLDVDFDYDDDEEPDYTPYDD